MILIKLDKKVWRGPRPQTSADVDLLRRRGVTRCLNLESGAYELLHGTLYAEDGLFAGSGLQLAHVPLGDVWPPTANELIECIQLLQAKGTTYVHCRLGVDRTGMVCAAYLVMSRGWTIEQAIHDMLDLGFHQWPYQYPLSWITSLRRFLIERGFQ